MFFQTWSSDAVNLEVLDVTRCDSLGDSVDCFGLFQLSLLISPGLLFFLFLFSLDLLCSGLWYLGLLSGQVFTNFLVSGAYLEVWLVVGLSGQLLRPEF